MYYIDHQLDLGLQEHPQALEEALGRMVVPPKLVDYSGSVDTQVFLSWNLMKYDLDL